MLVHDGMEGTETPNVKVIDFGFSCFTDVQNQDRSAGDAPDMPDQADVPSALGARTNQSDHFVRDPYQVPEANDRNGNAASETVDSFRLGCCLYVMLVATYPFDTSSLDVGARRAGKVKQYPRYR